MPKVSKELEGKYIVKIPKGQPLKRAIQGIGVVDFSTITIKQADALHALGVSLLEKVQAGNEKPSKPKPKPETK